jgi:hypothetical protein
VFFSIPSSPMCLMASFFRPTKHLGSAPEIDRVVNCY